MLLVHAGVLAGWFEPLRSGPELEGHRVVHVRRAGYVAGSPPVAHLGIADHARHCATLLDELGIEQAYWVGHSSSCLMGLQLAIERPSMIAGLVLLEPAPGGMLHGPADDRFVAEVVGPAMGAFVGGAPERALEIFMRAIGGDHARPVLEAALGDGAWDRAREESAFFFADELRAVREWQFGPDDAARISQPALIILGSGTPALMPNIVESVERLASALPNAVTEVLDGVDHMMPLEAPRALGEGIASFARRHPVAVPNRRGAA